jgi:hypothetical protein
MADLPRPAKPPGIEYAEDIAGSKSDLPTVKMTSELARGEVNKAWHQPYKNVRHKRTYDRRTGRKR